MNPQLRTFLLSWDWSPAVVLEELLGAGLYAWGWRRLRQRAAARRLFPAWHAWCFASGLLALALALLSPIAAYDDRFLFLHMVQHLLLLLVVPPLIWLGTPLLPMLWVYPANMRRWIGRRLIRRRRFRQLGSLLTHPLVAVLCYLVTIAVWHLPVCYNLAQGQTVWHESEHLFFLGAGLLYWWPVVHPTGGRLRLGAGADIVYLMAAGVEGGILGGILTFAAQPLYVAYEQFPRLWGLSAQLDQQLAGIIMWLGGGLIYTAWVMIQFTRMIQHEDQELARQASLVGNESR